MESQKTIAKSIEHTGTGLHTGCSTTVTFKPAPVDTGLVFVRERKGKKYKLPADVSLVADAPRRTTLHKDSVKIHTVEHILAAVVGMGIDNLEIVVTEAEIPEIDGSSLAFARLLEKAGIKEQNSPKRFFRLKQNVAVSHNDIHLLAIPSPELRISFTINYGAPILDTQYASFRIDRETFLSEIAPAKTFCFEREAKELRAQGLGKGANLSNTIVIGEDGIKNDALRFKDEFVRHKILDLLGDLSLVGQPVLAHIIAVRSGHSTNIGLMRKLRALAQESSSTDDNAVLDITGIKKILPHRYPFLLVDKIIDLEEDKRIVGIKNVTGNEEFFKGHFPQRPIMPGVLVVEAMAQTAGVLMLRKKQNIGKLAYVVSIDRVRLRKPVVPGDQLRLVVDVEKLRQKTGKVSGRAYVEGQLVAEGEFVFSVVGA